MSNLDTLGPELELRFRKGVDDPMGEDDFNDLALRIFRWQYDANPTYQGFCRTRGHTPDSVEDWRDVPAVPATAFKFVDLVCGDPAASEATFLTSGTTEGGERRGRHHVPSLALYRASALPPLRAHLVPEDAPLPILSLVPSPAKAPASSLSTMMGFTAEAWGDPVHWLADANGAPDAKAFVAAAREVGESGRPALVAGTAFAFVHLLDALARDGVRVRLPEGTRLMETGGFKGRSRTVGRGEFYGALEDRLGIELARMVNEYGMTELLSQLYEPVLREGPSARGLHVPPPWLRVRALDPLTLEALPDGESGVLAFFDLANAGSVAHVLTQDVGAVGPEGVRLRGRSAGAEPRGCSLALEEFLGTAGIG